jgi:hypothetical protein
MKLSDIKIGIRLSALAGFLLVMTILVGFQGWSKLNEANANDGAALQKAGQLDDALNTARYAQVQSKIQLQDWKNILLRSNDSAALEKYRAEFSKQSDDTQAALQKLKESLIALGVEHVMVDQALDDRQIINLQYLKALNSLDVTDERSAHTVDKMVAGIDRAPTKRIDDIVAYIRAQTQQSIQQARDEAQRRYQATSRFMLAIVLLALGVGSAITGRNRQLKKLKIST